MDVTRWIIVAYFIGWAFVFGVLAWRLRYMPTTNGDRVRWPILTALSYMGLVLATGYLVGGFIERDVSRELVRWILITATAPLGILVFKLMSQYWPWHKKVR